MRSNFYVAMDAEVFADGRHGIMLADKDCPEQGLPLDYPLKNADESVLKFENLITKSGEPGTIGRQVKGSFVGKILINAKTKRMSYALLSVKSVDVKELPPEESSPSAGMSSNHAQGTGRYQAGSPHLDFEM